ncbi:hypothetical protein DP923_10245 [Pontibacter arcticus]|uniref:Uncharacterized protein n=1 Tax=Pontibacter arcticus TaxID=2080288 RepID=A0A364RDD5_9BACT|nr:hypothetical protein DP923_10245 [Pontibacter arcticus]
MNPKLLYICIKFSRFEKDNFIPGPGGLSGHRHPGKLHHENAAAKKDGCAKTQGWQNAVPL